VHTLRRATPQPGVHKICDECELDLSNDFPERFLYKQALELYNFFVADSDVCCRDSPVEHERTGTSSGFSMRMAVSVSELDALEWRRCTTLMNKLRSRRA
jgi:hypothetical protein